MSIAVHWRTLPSYSLVDNSKLKLHANWLELLLVRSQEEKTLREGFSGYDLSIIQTRSPGTYKNADTRDTELESLEVRL